MGVMKLMYYEINVAKFNEKTGRYDHFFATDERSITNMFKLEEVVKVFKKKFPEEEGYNLTCTNWETRGEEITI